jgi:hypothetical protein
LEHRIGKSHLLVQLERARLDRERARRRPWLRGLVNDPDAHTESRQPEGQHQAGRAGADYQNVKNAGIRDL